MSVDQQFNVLSEKLHLLLKQYNRLQKENERLKGELQQAYDNELATRKRVEELEQQVSILKVATGDMNETDKRDFEKKINQYIREIDRCIAFLSQ
jgi:chromosome segregation ATPase